MGTDCTSAIDDGSTKKQPSEIRLALESALRHHQTGDLTRAESIYKQILATDPNNVDALHLLGVIAHQSGNTNLAIKLLKRAVSHDSNQPAFYNDLGNALQLQKNFAGAVENYEKALKLKPQFIEAAMNLGNLHRQSGNFKEAIALYRQAIKADPQNVEASYQAGSMLLEQKVFDEAGCFFQRVLEMAPDHIESHFKLGLVNKELGRWSEAIKCYERVLSIKPDLAEVHNNMGLVFKAQQRWDQAIASYRQALQLNPNLIEAYNNLGTILHQMGSITEALHCFEKALEVQPHYIESLHNFGNSLLEIGQLKKAIAYYRKALELRPEFVQAYYHMGLAFQNMDHSENAIVCFEKVLEKKPEFLKASCYLFHQFQQTCHWKGLEDLAVKIDRSTQDALRNAEKPAEMPFLSIVRNPDPKLNFQIAASWSRDLSEGIFKFSKNFSHQREPVSTHRITIGYLSNRFRNAATAQLMLSVFGIHNRGQFKIHCYSYGQNDGSYYRQKIEHDCDKFVDIKNMGYLEAAKCIYDDKVDILVDLKGYTRNNRLCICALRPAPIQVSYLGFPGSTGADFMDYIITDEIVTPEAEAPFYSEKFVYMPDSYMVNDHKKPISKKPRIRSEFGLPENDFVFCSFNLPYKIEPVLFDIWMKILNQVPDSVLWLLEKDDLFARNLKQEAKSRKIDSDRIVFAKKLPIDEHLARMQLADLVLDTRIYNGHTTTSDALWAGVPVVTLRGSHFASRVSASLLRAIGLPELISDTPRDYQALAVRLATRRDEYQVMRQKLNRNRFSQPLFDTTRFVRNLESAFSEMWKRYLAGEKPRTMKVAEG
jgi:protein O-GlcNAc transferase